MNLIVFDIDGTLTDTKKADDNCLEKTMKKLFGISLDGISWADFPHATDWCISQEIFKKHFNRLPSEEEYQEIKAVFLDLLRQELQEKPWRFKEISGAKKFLEFLQMLPDFHIAFATGSWEQSGLLKLQGSNILDKNTCHNYVISNSDLFISRENIVLHAIHQMEYAHKTRYQNVLYFGDGSWDLKTCKNLCIPIIGVDFHKDKQLLNLGLSEIIHDYTNIEMVMNTIYRNLSNPVICHKNSKQYQI